MKVYIAFLRSINVSGHHIIKMLDLKKILFRPEFVNLTTYLQSGNLIFESEVGNPETLQNLIGEIIKEYYGYDIKVKIYESSAFQNSFLKNPFLQISEVDTKKLYYIHVLGEADQAVFETVKQNGNFEEEMFLIENTIYVNYVNGYGRSKVTGKFFEKNLKLHVTARNFNTMKNLSEKLQNLSA